MGELVECMAAARVDLLKAKVKKVEEDSKILEQAYSSLKNDVNRGRALLTRLKKKTY